MLRRFSGLSCSKYCFYSLIFAFIISLGCINTANAYVCFLPDSADCAQGDTVFWPCAGDDCPSPDGKCDASYNSNRSTNECGASCTRCADANSPYYGLYKCPKNTCNCNEYTSIEAFNECGDSCSVCRIAGDKNYGKYKCPTVPASGCPNPQCEGYTLTKTQADNITANGGICDQCTNLNAPANRQNLYKCENCDPDLYTRTLEGCAAEGYDSAKDKCGNGDVYKACCNKCNGYIYPNDLSKTSEGWSCTECPNSCDGGSKYSCSCKSGYHNDNGSCVPNSEPEPGLGAKYAIYNFVDIWVIPYSVDGKIPGTSGSTEDQTLYTYAYIEDSNMEADYLRMIPFAVNTSNGTGSNDYPSADMMREIGLKPVNFDRGYFETIPGTSYSIFYKHSDLPTNFKEISKSEYNDLYFQLLFFNDQKFKEGNGIREVGSKVYECHKKAEMINGAKITTCEFETSVLKDSDNNTFVAKYVVRMSMDAIPGRTCPTGFNEANDTDQCEYGYDWLRADYKDNNCYACTCDFASMWDSFKDEYEFGESNIWYTLNHSVISIDFSGTNISNQEVWYPDHYSTTMNINFYSEGRYEDEGMLNNFITYNGKPYNIEITYPHYTGHGPDQWWRGGIMTSRVKLDTINLTTSSGDESVGSVYIDPAGAAPSYIEYLKIKVTHPDFEGWSETVEYNGASTGTAGNDRWKYLNGYMNTDIYINENLRIDKYGSKLNDYNVTTIVDELKANDWSYISERLSSILHEDNASSAIYRQDVYYNGQFIPFIVYKKPTNYGYESRFQLYIPLIECGTYLKFEFSTCEIPLEIGGLSTNCSQMYETKDDPYD